MSETGNLKLPFIEASQAQKHVTHNEALIALDAIVQASVLDRDLTAPPPDPAENDVYIVAASATGDWAGWDGSVAGFQDGAWHQYRPRDGWIVWVADEAVHVRFAGGVWEQIEAAPPGSVAQLGINAAADSINRLAVSSQAVLFNHEGNGVQAKLNKNAAGDTASLLFQTNWSARAEVGLTGDDDFRFKVSPDGSTFSTAFVVDKDDGMVSMPGHSKFSATSNFDNYIAADTWTKIGFNVANHNDQGDFDAVNARFVTPAAGYYAVGALFNFKENASVPAHIALRLAVNGAAVANTEQRYSGTIATLETSLNTHALLKLASGDTLDAHVYFATNDGYVEADTCAFWGAKIA